MEPGADASGITLGCCHCDRIVTGATLNARVDLAMSRHSATVGLIRGGIVAADGGEGWGVDEGGKLWCVSR